MIFSFWPFLWFGLPGQLLISWDKVSRQILQKPPRLFENLRNAGFNATKIPDIVLAAWPCNHRGHLQRCQMPDSRKTAETGAEWVAVKQPKNSRKNSTGRGRVQRKWVQPENVMFAQSLARSRPSGKIRQNPAKSGKIRQNPAKSGKIRLYPLGLYPPQTH